VNENMISYVLLGVIISVIVDLLLLKIKKLIDKRTPPPVPMVNRRPSPPGNGQQRTGHSSNSGRPSPPSRRRVPGEISLRRTPDMFPKCPCCGCKNSRGQTGLISWDGRENKWRCHNGHLFSS